MDATQGQCLFCGAQNSRQRTTCHECGTRLPWADELLPRKIGAAPSSDLPPSDSPAVDSATVDTAAGRSSAGPAFEEPPAAEPDVRISMPSQWLPPEGYASSSAPEHEQGPRHSPMPMSPIPTVVFSGGGLSRNCCCGCLFLVLLFLFLPLSCVMMTGNITQVGGFPSTIVIR
ncbi:MAG: hypothetical protein JWN98_2126 [Abditibacteriota bacterium]|nr:hypothetical protein [Abditibacteriota bacterium]